MAIWAWLARPTVRGQGQKRHALPEAGVQAQWTLLPARWQIYRAQDGGRPGAAYSGLDDPWQVHQGEAGPAKQRTEVGRRPNIPLNRTVHRKA